MTIVRIRFYHISLYYFENSPVVDMRENTVSMLVPHITGVWALIRYKIRGARFYWIKAQMVISYVLSLCAVCFTQDSFEDRF